MAKSSGSSGKSSSSAASKSTSSAASNSTGSTAKAGVSINTAAKTLTVPKGTSASTIASAKAKGYTVTVGDGGATPTKSVPASSGIKSYVVYDPKSGKTVVANMTASQVATANKMGINTVERSTGTSAKGASSPSEDAAPVVTAQQKAAKTLVDKGIAYAKNGSKLNIQVNSDLQGASSEQIKSWEAAGHTVTIVTTTDIQKDKHIGLGAKDDKKKPSDSLTVEDNADTSLNDSWDKVGKNNDPAAVSEFLNSQGGKYETEVKGDKIVGKKDGIETTWKYDKGNWVVDESATKAQKDSDISAYAEEVTQQQSGAIAATNAEPIKVQEENVKRLDDLYAQQDKAIQSRYSDMWARVKEAETKGLASLDEIDQLGRKMAEDNATQVARKVGGRMASQAASLSGQGFDASVVANLAGQIDSQYADERLAAQGAQIKHLNDTHTAYQDLYKELQNNASTLTTNERTFMEGIGNRIAELDKTRVAVAELKGSALQPWVDYWKGLSGTVNEQAASDSKTKAYQSSWEKNSSDERIGMLRSNINSFIGSMVGTDGKSPKYDILKITKEQLAEIAKNPNMQAAYEQAVAIITDNKEKAPEVGSTGGGSTGTKIPTASTPAERAAAKTPAPAPTDKAPAPTPAPTPAPAGNNSAEALSAAKKAALDNLNKLKGSTYANGANINSVKRQIENSNTVDEVVKFAAQIEKPAASQNAGLKVAKQTAYNMLNSIGSENIDKIKGTGEYKYIMESYKRIIAIGNNPSAIGTALSGDSEKAVIRETQELNRLINISKRNAGIK